MENTSLLMPPAASTFAGEVDDLYLVALGVSVVLFAAVALGLFVLPWIYRRRHPDQLASAQPGHTWRVGALWSVVLVAALAALAVASVRVHLKLQVAQADATEYRVVASQTAWQFTDPDGCVTMGELHVPAGKPVKLLMRSDDVAHTFYVPDLRVQQAILPGRYTSASFQAPAPSPGHALFCTQYGGPGHAEQAGKIVVNTPDEMAAKPWCEARGDAAAGEKLCKAQCSPCHTVDGNRLVGPSFKGVFGREEKLTGGGSVKVDEAYVVESIRAPMAKVVDGYPPAMPPFPTLKDKEVDAIILYLKTLK